MRAQLGGFVRASSDKDLMSAQLGGFPANPASSSSSCRQPMSHNLPNVSDTATPEESAPTDRNGVERVGRETDENAGRGDHGQETTKIQQGKRCGERKDATIRKRATEKAKSRKTKRNRINPLHTKQPLRMSGSAWMTSFHLRD